MKRKGILFLSVFSLFLVFGGILFWNRTKTLSVKSIQIEQNRQYDMTATVRIDFEPPFWKESVYCQAQEVGKAYDEQAWVSSDGTSCLLSVESGVYTLYLKHLGQIQMLGERNIVTNKILDLQVNHANAFLAPQGTIQLQANLVSFGEVDSTVFWKSDHPEVAMVENGLVTGVSEGKTVIRAIASNGLEEEVEVQVTPLIVTMPNRFQWKKKYLACNQYTKEEAILLDQILQDRIAKAGYQTRAGVVAAARFLTLEFPYRIAYFYENGRLENHYDKRKVDGEGRYYHVGLYLSEDKYSMITPSWDGPAMWGCPLTNRDDTGPYTLYTPYPNGLDCSGFVAWALLNGGFDLGDIGAGIDPNYLDFSDVGEKVTITPQLLNSSRVKVGDLIGLYGHIAMIVGMDDTNYYLAESLIELKGPSITVYSRQQLPSIYRYIMLMDDVYKNDGNLTNRWY